MIHKFSTRPSNYAAALQKGPICYGLYGKKKIMMILSEYKEINNLNQARSSLLDEILLVAFCGLYFIVHGVYLYFARHPCILWGHACSLRYTCNFCVRLR